MSWETLAFLESQQGEPLSPLDPRRIRAEAEASAAAAAREQAAREAEQAGRAEERALVNRQLGDPLGEASRARFALAEAQDEVTELTARLKKAAAKRDRALGTVEFWTQRMAAVSDSVRRSVPTELEASREARRMLAALKVDAELRAGVSRPSSGARRPFASRSRGAGQVVRSENCAWCMEQGASDREAFLLHSDPEFSVPVTPPGQDPQAAQAEQAQAQAARNERVNDLLAKGFSREVAELAQVPYGAEIAR